MLHDLLCRRQKVAAEGAVIWEFPGWNQDPHVGSPRGISLFSLVFP